jgi:tetratricopeptide (TPR) repeat protein
LGDRFLSRQQLSPALKAFRRGWSIAEHLVRQRPSDLVMQRNLKHCAYRTSWILDVTERDAESIFSYQRTILLCQRALRDHPSDPDLRGGLRASLHQMGTILVETGKPAQALEPYRMAIEIAEGLEREEAIPSLVRLTNAAGSWYRLGEALEHLGRREEAAAAYRHHLARYRRVIARAPGEPKYRRQLSDRLQDLARVLFALGRPAEAAEAIIECQNP